MQVASSLPQTNPSASASTSHLQLSGTLPPTLHLPLAQHAGAGPTAGAHHLKPSPPPSFSSSSSSSQSFSGASLSSSTPTQIATFLGAHLAASSSLQPSAAGAQHGTGGAGAKSCSQCETTNTPCWRRGPNGAVLCNACGLKFSRRSRNQAGPGDGPLSSVKPNKNNGKPFQPAPAGSVLSDGEGFGGSGGSHLNPAAHYSNREDHPPPPSRVNTAATLLQEIKKERERLSSSGGGLPHAREGSGPDRTQAPTVGYPNQYQPHQQRSGEPRPRVQAPWPLDNGRPTHSSADGEDVDGGRPALELFSGLHFMKPRASGGGSGPRSKSGPKSKVARGARESDGHGREEEDSDSSSGEEEGEHAVVLHQHNGAKRRQDNPGLALEQYAGESKRLRATREKKANLWTLDAHLHYLSIWLEYLNTYKNHIWTISPLDPAALDHNNARHLLCTNEGAEDRSALSLSVNFCLAIGALMHGDEKSHMEFYMRARQHLGYLFDTTDYSVALALIAMSHHTMYWEADAKRSEYYLTLAINIIAQLGAFHSDVYHRCLCMHSLTFRHGSSDLAKMVKLKQELRRAKQMPYYPITQSANSVVPYDMFRHLRFVTGATGIMTSVVAGINLFKAVSPPTLGSVSPEQQIVFRKLIQALDDLDDEIRGLQGMDAPSPSTSLTMLAFITALRAECYMCLGDYKTGLLWANRFLQDSRKPHFRFVIAGVVLMLDMIMGILLRANQFSMLAAQMDAIENNCVSCPTLDLVKNKYKKHLVEDLQRQHIQDSRTSSRSGDASGLALQQSQPQRPPLVAPLLVKREQPRGDAGGGGPSAGHLSLTSPAAFPPPVSPSRTPSFPSRSNQWYYYAGGGSAAAQASTSGFSPSSMLRSDPDSATPPPPSAESSSSGEPALFLSYSRAQPDYQGETEDGQQQQGEAVDDDDDDGDRDRYEAPSPPPLDDHEYFNGLLNDHDDGLLQQFLDS